LGAQAYYNEIVRNNVKHIHSLKDEITALKKKDEENQQLMFEIAEENKRLRSARARPRRAAC
jgi:hypothetical protein